MQTHTLRFCEHTVTYRIPCNGYCQLSGLGGTVDDSANTAELFASLLQGEPPEVFGTLWLTAKHRVFGYHEVGHGIADSLPVVPREIFRNAIVSGADAIVVAHNHTAAEPAPSREDIELAHRLVAAGTVLGVTVLDLIVISAGSYVSFRATGRLSPWSRAPATHATYDESVVRDRTQRTSRFPL